MSNDNNGFKPAKDQNMISITGRLTKDPGVRYTGTGKGVTEFTIAVNDVWSDGNGGLNTRVNWIPVQLWNASGEAAAKYLKKGRRVLVEGRIRVDSFDSEDGTRRYFTKIVGNNFMFLDSPASQPVETPETIEKEPPFDENIPF